MDAEAKAALEALRAARRALEARLSVIVTTPALRKREAKPAAAKRALELMSESGLAFAAQNPDHSSAGRAIARQALAARVGEAEAHRRIESFIDEMPEPGWITPNDLDRGDALFFGVWPWIRRGVLLAGLICVALWLGLSWNADEREQELWSQAVAQDLVTQAEVDRAFETVDNMTVPASIALVAEMRARPGVAELFAKHDARARLTGDAGIATIFLFPLYTVMLGWRMKPARVLLLRRFNDPEIGRSIERMSRRSLKPYGHVFTLADKHFRRSIIAPFFSWFSFNPFLLVWRIVNIPIALVTRLSDRSRAGPILVKDARDFRNFARRLIDRYGLNLEMERTQRKAIAVRTSDGWWQHVVLMLMHAADVIVVDITEVAAGTEWELETMLQERVGERVLFVAREDAADAARAALHTHGFGHRAGAISFYTKTGALIDGPAFRAGMLDALRRKMSRA